MNSTTQIQKVQDMALIPNIKATFTILASNKKEKSCTPRFEELFLETVDSALLLMGESSRQAIYRHLENYCGIKRESIPQNIAAFAQAVEAIFGQGARLLEIKIMRALHDSVCDFKYLPEAGELSFEDYVETLRRFL